MIFFNRHKRFAILLGIFFLLFVGSLVTWYELKYVDRFYPNTIVAGENVSGKGYQEVFDAVRERAENFEKNGFTVQIASSTIKIPAFSQGLTSDTVVEYFSLGDWQGELQRAYQMGRRGALFERISGQLQTAFSGGSLQFPYILQEASVRSLLTRELEKTLPEKTEAHFRIVNGAVEIASEVVGQTVSEDEIIAGLKNALATFRNTGITVVSHPDVPVVTAKKLEAVLDFARTLSAESSALVKFDGFSAYIPGWKLATWLTLKNEPGISLDINRDKMEEYVRASVDPYAKNAVRNSRFEMRDGILVETVSGVVGQAVDIDSFYRQLTGAISGMFPDSAEPVKLTVAMATEAPRVTKETIKKYGIKDLVGTVSTSFKGGTANRVHNITTGLAKINGILLAPGQEFSAVSAIGTVSEEDGYVEELVIKGDATIKEFGGGLCQIATTLFRLALDAGLPVTERVNHRYVVGYYGPGLDATIYGPHPDLKFVNDTKGYLLLQGKIVDGELFLELYGQKDNRTVLVTDPILTDRIPPPPPKYIPTYDMPLGVKKCTERAIQGVTSDVTYTVTYPDGRQAVQDFKSVYQPWAQVCLFGIATTF